MSTTKAASKGRTVTLTSRELRANPTAPIPGAARADRIVIKSDAGHPDIVILRQTRALPKQ